MDVLAADEPHPRQISDKIKQLIDKCNVVICLFTRRHAVSDEKWLPSQYVLSESAYAVGRYEDSPSKFGVYAFVEDGVDRNDLGIAFSTDIEVPDFSRDRASLQDKFRPVIKSYIEKLVGSFRQEQATPPHKTNRAIA